MSVPSTYKKLSAKLAQNHALVRTRTSPVFLAILLLVLPGFVFAENAGKLGSISQAFEKLEEEDQEIVKNNDTQNIVAGKKVIKSKAVPWKIK